jgi:hypothetical protein
VIGCISWIAYGEVKLSLESQSGLINVLSFIFGILAFAISNKFYNLLEIYHKLGSERAS